MARSRRRAQTTAGNLQMALPFDGDSTPARSGLPIPLVPAREAAEPISLEARRRRRRR